MFCASLFLFGVGSYSTVCVGNARQNKNPFIKHVELICPTVGPCADTVIWPDVPDFVHLVALGSCPSTSVHQKEGV